MNSPGRSAEKSSRPCSRSESVATRGDRWSSAGVLRLPIRDNTGSGESRHYRLELAQQQRGCHD